LSFVKVDFLRYGLQSCGFDGVVDCEFFAGFQAFFVYFLFLGAASWVCLGWYLLGFNPWWDHLN